MSRLDDEILARVRAQHELAAARRRGDRLYNQLRRLEDAVRDAALDQDDPRALLLDLFRRVPKSPRPTLTVLRKQAYARGRA